MRPVFSMPQGFVQRLGKSRSDSYFSGTYTAAGGVRIGFLRIPDFGYADTRVLDPEIVYMQKNTDALVVDIMRNPGGDACAAEETLSRLNAQPFQGLMAEIRVAWTDLLSVDSALSDALQYGADQDTIDQLFLFQAEFRKAFASESGALHSRGSAAGRTWIAGRSRLRESIDRDRVWRIDLPRRLARYRCAHSLCAPIRLEGHCGRCGSDLCSRQSHGRASTRRADRP